MSEDVKTPEAGMSEGEKKPEQKRKGIVLPSEHARAIHLYLQSKISTELQLMSFLEQAPTVDVDEPQE